MYLNHQPPVKSRLKSRWRRSPVSPSLLTCLYLTFQGRVQEGTAEGSDAPSKSGQDASGQQRRIRWVGDGRDTHPRHLSLRAVSLADGGRRRCTRGRGGHRWTPAPPLAGSDSRYRCTERGRQLPICGRCGRRTYGCRGSHHRGGGIRREAGDRGCSRGRGGGLLPSASGRGGIPRRRAHLLHERSTWRSGPRHGRRLPPDTNHRSMTYDTHAPLATAINRRVIFSGGACVTLARVRVYVVSLFAFDRSVNVSLRVYYSLLSTTMCFSPVSLYRRINRVRINLTSAKLSLILFRDNCILYNWYVPKIRFFK